jgi:MFS family permease
MSIDMAWGMEPVELSLEEALELCCIGFFHYRLLLLCGLAYMAGSLEVNLLSFLSTCVGAEWGLSNSQQAFITATVFLGMIAGSIFWGPYADAHGRRRALLACCLTVAFGSIISAMSPSLYILLISRTICGFGIGGASIPFDLLAEFMAGPARGVFLINIAYFWSAGSMFVVGVAWLTMATMGWRFLALTTAVPVLLTSMLAYVYLPESPHWLVQQGRREEAMQVIRQAALVNGVVIPSHFKLSDRGIGASQCAGSAATYRDLLRAPETRATILPLWTIWGIFGFTYYSIILFISRIYSNQDSVSAGREGQCDFDYPVLFGNASSEIVSVLVSGLLIDRLGRTLSQSLFYTMGGISVLLMSTLPSPLGVIVFSTLARICASSSNVSSRPHCIA